MFYQRESRGPIFWNFQPFQLRPITFKIESTSLDLWIKGKTTQQGLFFVCYSLQPNHLGDFCGHCPF